jgi:iron(III) transport system substrate-binding protein
VRVTSRRSLRWLTLMASLGLFAAACGGDNSGSSSGAATTAAAAATTAAAGGATTTAAAGGATTTAAAGGATTAASSASLDALVAAAKKEGKVTIYSSQALDGLNKLAADFKAAYPGVDAEVVRGIDGDLAPKVEAEHQTGNGIADLYVSASLSWVQSKADAGDWFVPVAAPNLLGQGEYDAKQYVHPGNYFEVGAALLTFGWNTELVPKGIKDYPDLLDPSLKGKIGVPEPTSPSIVDFYLWLNETYGADYMQKLAAQQPRIYPSSLPITEALGSGEIAATPFTGPALVIPAKAKGAPVEFAISPEGAWGARYFGMVLKTAPHPNAAQLLANFMVTTQGQADVMANAGTVLPNVPGGLLTNDKVRKQDLAALTPDKVSAFQQEWNSLYR